MDRVAGSTVRADSGRRARSRADSWLGSGGTGRPGTGYSCSPETRSAAREVARTFRPGRSSQQVGHDRPGVEHLLEVVEHEQHPLAREPFGEDIGGRAPGRLGDPDRGGEARRHERRFADRLERHEEHAVGEVLRGVRRDLERQAGLAGPARAGQRDEPVGSEEPARLLELALAADERRQLGREVVRAGVEGAQRREIEAQPVRDDLAQRLRLAQVLEPVVAEAAKRDSLGQVDRDERANRVGHHDLAAVGRRRDPRRAVDVEPDQAGGRDPTPRRR